MADSTKKIIIVAFIASTLFLGGYVANALFISPLGSLFTKAIKDYERQIDERIKDVQRQEL